jgi:hypothetical protein
MSPFKPGIIFVVILFVAGFLLQILIGNINFALIKSPNNLFIGAILILLIVIFSLFKEKPVSVRLSGIHLSVALIAALLFLCLIMGLIPQTPGVSPHNKDFYSVLGFRNITSSWPFVLVYFFILLSLGVLIGRKLYTFRIADYAFYLNHTGIWIILFAAGLGAADMRRYTMMISEGSTESYGKYEKKSVKLPFSIKLKDFHIDEYPPKLMLVNHKTGIILPEKRPAYYSVDPNNKTGQLDNYNLTLLDFIPNAVIGADNDYIHDDSSAGIPAVKISITERNTGEKAEGWVYRGDNRHFFKPLIVDSLKWIVMNESEPSKYVSDILIVKDDKTIPFLLEVNKPVKLGFWTIYQYGYDTKAGKNSQYSIIEIVYDPWLKIVYAGIIMLFAGSLCMLWKKSKVSKL